MSISKSLLVVMLCCAVYSAQAQHVEGVVFDNKDRQFPLAQVILLSDNDVFITQTNDTGYYHFDASQYGYTVKMILSGYDTTTVTLSDKKRQYTYLKTSKWLNEVQVTAGRKSTEIGLLDTRKHERLSTGELQKAACCNLSESFETTPSVDVAFTDAVSGYKQIQMLGLAGPYTHFTRENIPDVRGLSAITGLTFTPGTWIEGIQLSKGSGSVVNGMEGVSGQINVEWLKPFETDRLKFNLYQSTQGRTEANLVWSEKINDTWSTNTFLHTKQQWLQVDQNKDQFLDQPLGAQYVVANRWYAFLPRKWEWQIGFKGSYSDMESGQLSYFTDKENPTQHWYYTAQNQQLQAWSKLGKVFNKPWQSLGLQVATSYYKQEAQYHVNPYNGKDQNVYLNLIYQSIISNTNHVIKGGISNNYDAVDEQLMDAYLQRREYLTGAFAEYAYSYLDQFNIVAGMRWDYSSLFGHIYTPRLHMRWAPWQQAALRLSVGRSQRTANPYTENLAYFASARSHKEPANVTEYATRFTPEKAWNYGMNYTHKFKLNYREAVFSTDYYYTHFLNQVVVDIEDPQFVNFYTLDNINGVIGRSFAHSFQVQFDYELIRKMNVRLAYRLYDVKTTYKLGGLMDKPLISKHRAFINVDYKWRDWMFDATAQLFGPKRLPKHILHGYVMPSSWTSSYTNFNAQVTKSFKKQHIDLYVGMENILNRMQHDLILNSAHPFDTGFDASLIWGNGMGRNMYLGMRLDIK